MSDIVKEYEKDVRIAYDALEIEWIHHAEKYLKWSMELADINKITDEMKKELARKDAEIDIEIRAKHEGATKKPTESYIKSMIALDRRHIEAEIELNDALHRERVYKGIVDSMAQKKTALENLVKLWIGGYFAGPKEPRDLKEEFGDKKRKEIIEDTGRKLRQYARSQK